MVRMKGWVALTFTEARRWGQVEGSPKQAGVYVVCISRQHQGREGGYYRLA